MITNCLPQPLPRLRWLQLPRHARADAQAEEDWGKGGRRCPRRERTSPSASPSCRRGHLSRRPRGRRSLHRRLPLHSGHASARLRADARGRDGGIRKELAAGVSRRQRWEATASSLNVKTARSWRGIVPSTHLAREGRMTVTIGRRELLAALGGAAAAWPLAARAQQTAMPVIGFLHGGSAEANQGFTSTFRQGLKQTGF